MLVVASDLKAAVLDGSAATAARTIALQRAPEDVLRAAVDVAGDRGRRGPRVRRDARGRPDARLDLHRSARPALPRDRVKPGRGLGGQVLELGQPMRVDDYPTTLASRGTSSTSSRAARGCTASCACRSAATTAFPSPCLCRPPRARWARRPCRRRARGHRPPRGDRAPVGPRTRAGHRDGAGALPPAPRGRAARLRRPGPVRDRCQRTATAARRTRRGRRRAAADRGRRRRRPALAARDAPAPHPCRRTSRPRRTPDRRPARLRGAHRLHHQRRPARRRVAAATRRGRRPVFDVALEGVRNAVKYQAAQSALVFVDQRAEEVALCVQGESAGSHARPARRCQHTLRTAPAARAGASTGRRATLDLAAEAAALRLRLPLG